MAGGWMEVKVLFGHFYNYGFEALRFIVLLHFAG